MTVLPSGTTFWRVRKGRRNDGECSVREQARHGTSLQIVHYRWRSVDVVAEQVGDLPGNAVAFRFDPGARGPPRSPVARPQTRDPGSRRTAWKCLPAQRTVAGSRRGRIAPWPYDSITKLPEALGTIKRLHTTNMAKLRWHHQDATPVGDAKGLRVRPYRCRDMRRITSGAWLPRGTCGGIVCIENGRPGSPSMRRRT